MLRMVPLPCPAGEEPGSGRHAVILGVGSDLIDIRRIEKAIERFGDRFLDRIFTETERRRCDRRGATRVPSYARRFAAKEAAAKALGTGFRSGVFWRDLGVVNLPSGQPGMRLTGGALQRLEAITPPGMSARLDVSLTDEPPLAQAVVIITALPATAAPAA
jgi:holo-[acyl-carrier protein] synthase